MSSPREEMMKYWESVCSQATDMELHELLRLHRQDPHRVFEGPRGECIEREIRRRDSQGIKHKIDGIVGEIEGRS